MYDEIRSEIVKVCHKLWLKGWAAANDGNISVRVDDGLYLATRTGISKGDVTENDIGLINDKLEVIDAVEGFRPSSEIKMHIRCYALRNDVCAVVHAHPPYATAFACAHQPLADRDLIGTVLELGDVPLVPYATPSTEEVPDAIAPYITGCNGLLLANHGALTVGCDLTTAYYRMETLEQQAHISILTRILGGAVPLSREALQRLAALRPSYGITGRFEDITNDNK